MPDVNRKILFSFGLLSLGVLLDALFDRPAVRHILKAEILRLVPRRVQRLRDVDGRMMGVFRRIACLIHHSPPLPFEYRQL